MGRIAKITAAVPLSRLKTPTQEMTWCAVASTDTSD
jgi:hypothetical protein